MFFRNAVKVWAVVSGMDGAFVRKVTGKSMSKRGFSRRDLGTGAAALGTVLMAGQAGAQSSATGMTPQAAPGSRSEFYTSFNDQLARVRADLQPDIRRFYEAQDWRPVWTSEQRRQLGEIANLAPRHGLSAQDHFDFVGLASDPSRAEMRTTEAVFAYARVLSEGRVRPESVESLWEMQRNRADIATGLGTALAANRLVDWMESLAPTDIGYGNLSAGYVRYRQLAERGGWPGFRAGARIDVGGSDSRIPALRARLLAEGDITREQDAMLAGTGTLYAPSLEAGVRSFQIRHGLLADGIIGQATQNALTASAEDRARQIALNLERRRWLRRELSPERIEVNTAAAIMVYWRDNRPVHSNRVVVGTPRNQTPSLEKPFASVVANPPWYVPASIARNEILPRGPGYLASQNMYIAPGGNVVQRAGPNAALGLVKFELRDSHAIFLHDTPSKAAFNNAYRHRSHGCVRVQDAVEFARLLLSPDPAQLGAFDTAIDSRRTQRVETGREISVRLLYWTAFVDGQGRVAFREDVYSRDQRLAEALGINLSLPRVIDDGRADPRDVGP